MCMFIIQSCKVDFQYVIFLQFSFLLFTSRSIIKKFIDWQFFFMNNLIFIALSVFIVFHRLINYSTKGPNVFQQ